MIFNLQEGRMLVEKSMHLQTQTEWEEEMAYKVLRLVHDELYVELRFMGAALSELTPAPDKRLTTAATDGAFTCVLPKSRLPEPPLSPYGAPLHFFPSVDFRKERAFSLGDCL